MSRILCIFGSAREEGDTHAALSALLTHAPRADITTLSLLDVTIHPYCYSGQYPAEDAFHVIAGQMTKAEWLVFATPVYWYAMSGRMKQFIDRFTDLITIHKPTGRALAGKKVLTLACGAAIDAPPGFMEPFSATTDYLGMDFRGGLYYHSGNDAPLRERHTAELAEAGRQLQQN